MNRHLNPMCDGLQLRLGVVRYPAWCPISCCTGHPLGRHGSAVSPHGTTPALPLCHRHAIMQQASQGTGEVKPMTETIRSESTDKKPVAWDIYDDDGFWDDDLRLDWYADDQGGFYAHGDKGCRLRVSATNDWAVFDSDTTLWASGQTYILEDCTAAMLEAEAVAAAYFDSAPALPAVVTADDVRSVVEKFHPALGSLLSNFSIAIGPPDAPMFKLADFREDMGLIQAAVVAVNRVEMWFEGSSPQLLTDEMSYVLELVKGSVAKLHTVLEKLGIDADAHKVKTYDGPVSSVA